MTWVRYDDNVRNHPKVEPLDDATYRLWREAIEWSATSLADGQIRSHQLMLTSKRATRPRAGKLVSAGLWHLAGTACASPKCPPSGVDGWVIHDYFDYQPTRQKVREEQAAKAERQTRWLEKKKGGPKDASQDASQDALEDASKDGAPAPPRPAPKGRGGTTSHQRQPAAVGGVAAAGGEAEKQNPLGPDSCDRCGNSRTSGYHRRWCLTAESDYPVERQAIDVCPDCDEIGYLPNGQPCSHDPSREARNRQGAATVRAAIAERRTA